MSFNVRTSLVIAVAIASFGGGLIASSAAYDAAATSAWREKREAEFKSPEGWLTVAGLHFLKPGDNTIGTDPANDIVLPEGTAPLQAGVVNLTAPSTVSLTLASGVQATGDGAAITGRFTFRDGDAKTKRQASKVTLNSLNLQVHRSGDRVAIRLRDPKSALLRDFHGLRWYPIEEKWNVQAKFIPFATPKRIPTQNILGDSTISTSPGEVELVLNGTTVRLLAYQAGEGLSFVLSDTAPDTYRLRFLSAPKPAADGSVTIDFNRAYNPPCAFNPYTTCPIPPAQNRLKVAVQAGERAYTNHSTTTASQRF